MFVGFVPAQYRIKQEKRNVTENHGYNELFMIDIFRLSKKVCLDDNIPSLVLLSCWECIHCKISVS